MYEFERESNESKVMNALFKMSPRFENYSLPFFCLVTEALLVCMLFSIEFYIKEFVKSLLRE
jgi:hypothetical protein